MDLHRKYNEILHQEHEFWAIRYKTNWLHQGDLNTQYFHAMVKARRRSQLVSTLKSTTGDWVSTLEDIRDLFENHFKEVYRCNNFVYPPTPLLDLSSYNSPNPIYQSLADPVSFEEVTSALFQMGLYKAPGPELEAC